ncbi:hypothetical protein BJ912DRAFT_955324 [Pholiota molesta]|nr:hypothetical protein BJ912DRAFT_955324 [Pholiota molesta]
MFRSIMLHARPSSLSGSYLRTLALYTLLSTQCVANTRAQGGGGLDDLPACAVNCARTAATAIGCSLQNPDPSCLCSSHSFIAATVGCASSVCPIEDQSTLNGVLDTFCSAFTSTTTSTRTTTNTTQPTTTTSAHSTSSTSSQPSPTSQTTATSSQAPPTPSPTPTGSAPPTFAPGTTPGTAFNPGGPIISAAPSSLTAPSTSVVVQTVTLPPSATVSGAGSVRRDAGPGWGFFVGAVCVWGLLGY